MNKKLFADLEKSMAQMNEIAQGKRAPSREFRIDALPGNLLRPKPGLTRPKFAKLSERDRREPTGPSKLRS